MDEQINSITYIKYISNVVKNLKMLYFSFSEDEVTFLKNMIIALNNNEVINIQFLQVFTKYGLIKKDENGKNVAKTDELPLELNQYFSKIYISLLDEISKYLNRNSDITDDVIEQLKLLKENLPNRISGINNIIKDSELPEKEIDFLNVAVSSVIHSTQFSNLGNVSKEELSENIEACIQIAESAVIGPKHLGLAESDVKDIIDSDISKEVNRDMGFYNYGDKEKINGLGYYN